MFVPKSNLTKLEKEIKKETTILFNNKEHVVTVLYNCGLVKISITWNKKTASTDIWDCFLISTEIEKNLDRLGKGVANLLYREIKGDAWNTQ